jgi:inosine-uridine nucleoside N-ribohydrolase
MRVHVDTDFGGDPDDACALAMLLVWPDVEIVGITTNLDRGGRRAGCVWWYLQLAGRSEIPVVAGAGASLTTLERYESTWGDTRYWREPVAPRPAAPGAAVDLLAQSIADGAIVIALGAFTNLALLEKSHPGSLDGVSVVATAGWLAPLAYGLPAWGPAMDFNVQCDTRAAIIVAASADLTLVTLPATIKAHLRSTDLPRLRATGPLGAVLAVQSEAYATDARMAELGRSFSRLPDDLVNFQWDPVTCAVAVGWAGATCAQMRLSTEAEGDVLRFRESAHGRPTRVVVDIDADDFGATWLRSIAAADTRSGLH